VETRSQTVAASPFVRGRIQGEVLHITLDRPAERNALNYKMMTAVADLVSAAGQDPSVRAILLRGHGDAFCVGDTPGDMGAWPERFQHRYSIGPHGAAPVVEQHMLRTVRAVAKPVVAALKGPVLGLGFDLSLVCDFRLAADTATLGDPRVLQGRHAATGVSYLLPRLIGLSRASWMLLTGESLDAAEAARIGLVHQVYPAAALEAQAAAFADKLAGLATRSYAVKKEMTLAQLDMSFETAMMHCLAVRQTNVIEDVNEGIAAWREKRPPRFTGR
jgi:enoyl-CoA hydratase/carnithine racemase